MLDDDCRVCDKRPELVGTQAGIALKMVKKRLFVGVVVRICSKNVNTTFGTAKGHATLER